MSMEPDLRELEYYLESTAFAIPTRQIMDLQELIEEWVFTFNDCGAIIYGRSRSGKTCAIRYLSRLLQQAHGSKFPVFIYGATAHMAGSVTDKRFYSALLSAVGHEDPHHGSAQQLRDRLVRYLICCGLDTPHHKVLLFIDEAYLLDHREFQWLIGIENALDLEGVRLAVLLVGTSELKALKNMYIKGHKEQILHRFMEKETEFHGITSMKDLQVCLTSLEAPCRYSRTLPPVALQQAYFPQAYADNPQAV